MVSFKFQGCTFVGNDITCNFNAPSSATSVSEFAFTGCVFRFQANFSEFIVDGNGTNFNLIGNTFRFTGIPVTVGGVDKYNLPVPIVSLYDIKGYAVTGNSFCGVLPIYEAPAYMRVNGTSSGKFQGNLFPQADILTTGGDVAVVGTNTNVTILESQQTSRRLLNTVIPNGTYNLASPTIASINTICTKPQAAIVQLYIDTSTITNPGLGDMIIECVGLGPFAGNKYQVNGTGTNGINAIFVGTVFGTVSFNITTNFQIVTTTGASQRSFMSITFI
jgi:hypothetical protein